MNSVDMLEENIEKLHQKKPQQFNDQEEKEDLNSVLDELMTPVEIRRASREAKRPIIDHLEKANLAEVKPGDRLVVERRQTLAAGNPWLTTTVCIVKKIDEAGKVAHCEAEDAMNYTAVVFDHPMIDVRVAPKTGNPFQPTKGRRRRRRRKSKL